MIAAEFKVSQTEYCTHNSQGGEESRNRTVH